MAPLISSTTARSAAAAGVPGSASPIKAALAEMASNNDTRRRRIMSFTLGRPAQPDMGRTWAWTWPGHGLDYADFRFTLPAPPRWARKTLYEGYNSPEPA